LITSIVKKAQKEIVLIDGYVDVDTLNILAKKNTGVDVKIYNVSARKPMVFRPWDEWRQF
jgi:hypothetical protein